MFSLNENIQAVDELGRWESGKIVDIVETSETEPHYKIHFPGWSAEFDVSVSSTHVRKPIDCFCKYQYYRFVQWFTLMPYVNVSLNNLQG